jgi:uncharacterized protein (TIGR02001 family)
MTIKKTLIGAASVAALAVAAAAAPAAADGYAVESAAAAPASDAREFAWSITVGGTSDYIFRGVSLSDNDPAFQASVDMSYGIFYAGVWGSNLGVDDSYPGLYSYGPAEIDLYAGVKPVWGPVTFDLGTVLYLYPGESQTDYTYVEFKAGASMELVKSLTGGAVFWYTPDQSNYFEGYAIEGTLAYAFPQMGIFTPSVSGLIGYAKNDDASSYGATANDYTYWNAGLSVGVEKFTMDFRYWDTNISDTDAGGNGNFFAGERFADERFVFTAKVTLP